MVFGFISSALKSALLRLFTQAHAFVWKYSISRLLTMVRCQFASDAISGNASHEKALIRTDAQDHRSPVVDSAQFIYEETDLVRLDPEGIKRAAQYIKKRLINEKYTPSSWRTHPLHLCPPDPFMRTDPRTKGTLDWLFLISSLNFCFWSECDDSEERYGVDWRKSWESEERVVWTGYWSLVAAINRALEANIPITDPTFYSSPTLCPDSLLENVFRPAPGIKEKIPLLKERIAIMREVGSELCRSFGGSYQSLLREFERLYGEERTALQLVQMVTEYFPSFRDECVYRGRKVYIWKRAQILVAETWAAFYPSDAVTRHPFFPAGVQQLTMFADYRVPQILHYLLIVQYPKGLVRTLREHTLLPCRCREEMSIRAASILAVEAIRDEIKNSEKDGDHLGSPNWDGDSEISSVLIDFYLWDLAKSVESGEQSIDGIQTGEMIPPHRTRSIWY